MIQSVSKKAADDNRRCKTKNEFAARSGEKCGIGTVRFGGRSGRGNGHRGKGFDQPDSQPGARRNLSRSRERGHQCGNSMATPPQPGTAVNSAALSMVSRM